MILSGPEDAATEDDAVITGLKRVPNNGFEQDPRSKFIKYFKDLNLHFIFVVSGRTYYNIIWVQLLVISPSFCPCESSLVNNVEYKLYSKQNMIGSKNYLL